MEIQNILRHYVGEMGRYQFYIWFLLTISRVPLAIHVMGIVFYAATPDHWCAYTRYPGINLTEEQWKELSIPAVRTGDMLKYSRCTRYSRPGIVNFSQSDANNILRDLASGNFSGEEFIRPCDSWEYDHTTSVRSSLVTEWDMVCDRAWMKSLLFSLYMASWMLSGQLVGYASDRFESLYSECSLIRPAAGAAAVLARWGRRLLLRVLAVGVVVAGNVLPFCNNYIAFLVFRFILASAAGNYGNINYALSLEPIGDGWRALFANLAEVCWAVSYAALAGVGYLLRDRFMFMIVLSVPTVLMLIPNWLIPESFRWLIAKGHYKEAQLAIHKMAKVNRRKIPVGVTVTVEQDEKKASSNLRDLFRSSGLRSITFIMGINGIANGMLYYAISWNMSDYHGNLYLNVFFAGLVEVPAYLLNITVVSKIGRQRGMIWCMLLAGTAVLLSLAIPESVPAAKITLIMIAKFAITMAFATGYQYGVELYPTVIRSSGLHWFVNACRLGSLTAPFLPLIGGVWPDVICAGITLLGALLTLLIPETLGVPLPATVEEAERRCREHKIRYFLRRPKPSQKAELPEEVALNNMTADTDG